jgi:hypothetical protein
MQPEFRNIVGKSPVFSGLNITIHESRHSIYPVVIIPLPTKPYIMLNRNLIYTFDFAL